MPDSNNWKLYPLPPNWEEKYDPNTKLNYYVDHANQKTTWTDPRSWYYDKDRSSTADNSTIRELIAENASDDFENLQESLDDLEGNESVKLTCATKTNSIVNNFLNEEYDPKRDQGRRKSKPSTSATRKSTSRRRTERNSESQSLSTVSTTIHTHRQSLSPETPSRDAISVDTGLKKRRDAPSAPSASKTETRTEKRNVEQLKSVPENQEAKSTKPTTKTESKPEKPTEPVKVTSSDSIQKEKKEEDKPKEGKKKAPSRPPGPFVRSSLYIQAKGPNRSLLVQRIPAKGPNPELRKGPNPALVKGSSHAILITNR